MVYSIFDRGNLVVAYGTPEEAQAAFEEIAAVDGQPLDSLLLVAFDDRGEAVADYAPGESVLVAA